MKHGIKSDDSDIKTDETIPPAEPWRLIAPPSTIHVYAWIWNVGTKIKEIGERRRWPWLIRLGYNIRWGLR